MTGRITMLITQVVGDLDIESPFEDRLGHLRQQPLRAVNRGTGGFSVSQQGIDCRRR